MQHERPPLSQRHGENVVSSHEDAVRKRCRSGLLNLASTRDINFANHARTKERDVCQTSDHVKVTRDQPLKIIYLNLFNLTFSIFVFF